MQNNIIADELILSIQKLKKHIMSHNRWGYNLNEKEFIKGMSLLTPQSYGGRIEKKIKEDLGFDKVLAKLNKGDLVYKNVFFESKVSIINDTNPYLNLVQIRLFHDIDYYLCIAYDIRDLCNFQKYMYLLSHNDMTDQCKKYASAAHGTKSVNKENSNVEMRFSLEIAEGNKIFQEWNDNFRVNSYEEVKSKCIVKNNP